MKFGNCLIAQSGGPTAAINASLAGVYKAAKQCFAISRIYGATNGIEGVLEEKLIDLSYILEKDDNLNLLKTTPSSFLGSCRYKLKEQSAFERIYEIFEKFNIKYFFYIGGNDSMDAIMQLKNYGKEHGKEVVLIGVPKTIDNDLMCIDHTPGFGSAAKYIATTVKEIACDTNVYDKESIVIVEVMGRHAGWLALSGMLATDINGKPIADLIYLPECVFDYEKFANDVKKVLEHKKQIIIVVSEGIKDAEGNFIAEAGTKDSFGHGQLGGAGKHVENYVKENLGIKVRSVELSILQRCAGHCLSARDINESFMIGEKAVEVALNNRCGVMVTTERAPGPRYSLKLGYTDIDLIANKEKIVPENFINEDKNHGTKLAMDYLLPLIQGDLTISSINGIPNHLNLRDFIK